MAGQATFFAYIDECQLKDKHGAFVVFRSSLVASDSQSSYCIALQRGELSPCFLISTYLPGCMMYLFQNRDQGRNNFLSAIFFRVASPYLHKCFATRFE